jgi:hypothetical protein
LDFCFVVTDSAEKKRGRLWPAFTVEVCGVKVKSSIVTALEEFVPSDKDAPARPEPTIAPKTAAAITDRIIIFLSFCAYEVPDRLNRREA